jgi:CubicO group peptidase (beta-lactamase class C family)
MLAMVNLLEGLYVVTGVASVAALAAAIRGRRGAARRAGLAAVLLAGLSVALYSYLSQPARAETDARFERIRLAVEEKMKEYGVPGAAVGISFKGQTATHGLGVTSVDHPLPVTDDTLFQVGSISKTFTGMLVMRLAESGKLKLDARVQEYIPSFRVKDPAASRGATLLTTLTHMGGWEGDFFDDTGSGDDALSRVVDRMSSLEQVAPFDTLWSYNNAGFYLAGRAIEIAAGKPFEQALKEQILETLGLKRTFIFPADVMTERFVVGHSGPMAKPSVARPWPLARAAHAAGGVVASVADLVRYGQFHLGDGGVPGGARVLAAASLQRMHTTQVRKHGTDDEMAITWHVSNAGGVRQIAHGGATVGQQAQLTLVPSEQLVIALLTNSGRGAQLNRDVTRIALKEYLGITITDPSPIAVPASELAQYAGRYSRPFSDVVVTQEGERLRLQIIQKQGFPTPTTPVPPAQPGAPYAFYAKDRLIAVDGPAKGARAEIIRLPDGSIGWIRVGSRVSRRVAGGTRP